MYRPSYGETAATGSSATTSMSERLAEDKARSASEAALFKLQEFDNRDRQLLHLTKLNLSQTNIFLPVSLQGRPAFPTATVVVP